MRQTTLSVFRPIAVMAAALGAVAISPAAFAADYATVISSTPVMAQVPVPRQQCSQGTQYVQQAPTGIGAVIGAVAGGVIGNAVGGGFGRAAATGLGVVGGAIAGNQVESNGNPVSAVPVTQCQNVTGYENRVVGYDVTYEYAGKRYNTRMAQDPGRQFAVDVQPTGAAAPAPAQVYADPNAPAYYNPLPQPAYAAPYPYYAPAPVVVGAPVVSVGLGYYGWGGRRWH